MAENAEERERRREIERRRQAERRGKAELPDAVQRDRLLSERVQKERQWLRLYTRYTVNPLLPGHMVTGKPMSWHDNMQEPTDDEFLNLFHRAVLEPTKKYSEPQTESQEIGWNTTPLVPLDRSDCRLYFPRRITEITIHGCHAAREKEPEDS